MELNVQCLNEFSIRDSFCLLFNSLISYRRIQPIAEMRLSRAEFLEHLSRYGLKETGPFITVLHRDSVPDNPALFDFEFMVPLPFKIPLREGFSFVPKLMVTDAVCVHHDGSRGGISGSYIALCEYLLTAATGSQPDIFFVDVVDSEGEFRRDNPAMEVYIGTGRRIES